MKTKTAVVRNWHAVTTPGKGSAMIAHLLTIDKVEEHVAYIVTSIVIRLGLGLSGLPPRSPMCYV